MKIVIAIDSFKGSISSITAGNVTAKAVQLMIADAKIKIFPLADGGEGTVDAITEGLNSEIVPVNITGPLGNTIMSRYGYIPATNTAIIEIADAAGLTMVPQELRNPLNTTTYGLGELILAALDKGCRNFIIGIGGSATNDAGLGILTALGARFYKADGSQVGIFGKDLADIAEIDLSSLDKRLKAANFRIACDVNNPLCGKLGCSAIYGPQKGATPKIVELMDNYIHNFAALAATQCHINGADLPGAGAAGGLGYAFQGFMGAQLQPGVELILNTVNIADSLKDADILITGEGCIDVQTAMGKGPIAIAQLAKQLNPRIMTLAFCGCASPEAEEVNKHGIDAYFPILHQVSSLDDALEEHNAARNLAQTVTQVFRTLCMAKVRD